MRRRLSFAFAALAALGAAAAENPATGFMEVLRPSADAALYLDTAQGKRGVDPELDRQIGEKLAALRKEEGDPLAKPFLLAANVDLLSRDPLRIMADGRIRFEDIASITNLVAAWNQVGDKESGPRLKLTLGENREDGCPFDLLFNQAARVPRGGSGPSPVFARVLAAMRAGDPFFVLVFSGRRFAPFAKDVDTMRFLFSSEVVGIRVAIDGKLVRFTAMVSFVDEETATENASFGDRAVKQLVSGVLDGAFRDFKVSRDDLAVTYSFVADNAKIWGMDEVRKDDGQKPVTQ